MSDPLHDFEEAWQKATPYKYEFKTTPFHHQKLAMRGAYLKPGYAWFMEMGTGKTKVAIDEMSMLFEQNFIQCAIVIAPKAVYMNWTRREIPVHMPDRIFQQALVFEWRAGCDTKEYRRLLEEVLKDDGRFRILAVNIEALSTGNKAMDFVTKFMETGECAVYVDESTTIKHQNSKRAARCVKLGRMAKYRRILTGSPVTNSPLDVYQQFEFLGPRMLGFSSFYSFRGRYAITKQLSVRGRHFKPTIVVGYKNLDDLTERVAKHSFRVLKEDCLDLPPKIYQVREIEMTDEQAHVYKQMRDNCYATLEGQGSTVTASQIITQMMRLQHIAAGFVKNDEGEIQEIKSNRLGALMSTLEEVSGKAIIWAPWVHNVHQIIAALKKEYGPDSVAEFYGATKDRQEQEMKFQTDPRCRWMVSNQQTGARGRTWTAANTTIYYDNLHELEYRLQSEDRNHREGLKGSATYIDLIMTNTLNAKILKALREMRNIASEVNGDNYRQWINSEE